MAIPPQSSLEQEKEPFDVEEALGRVREAVRGLPQAALFELAARGHRSLFEQLVACVLSTRTRDEVTLPVALRLLARARTPWELCRLGPAALEALIRPVTFHEPKVRQLQALARRAMEEYGGELPCEEQVLRSLPGVGPKCAHLALGIACGQPAIAVDVHVHRVTNRWGCLHTHTPEQTEAALAALLPRAWWVELNRLLVPFGKHVCTRERPLCSSCPLLPMCRQVGVHHPR